MTDSTNTDGAIEGTGGFVAAWLNPGDAMYSGGNVPDGLFGLRLHGTDTEMLGTPAELGELGDRLAARWDSPKVDAFNQFALRLNLVLRRGFTTFPQDLSCGDVDEFALVLALHGDGLAAARLVAIHAEADQSGEEHAHIRALAEAADVRASGPEMAESDYAEADAAAYDYVRSLLPAGTGTGRAEMKAQFLALTAESHRLDAEADRLCDEANESGEPNDEFEVRAEAGQVARAALDLAETLLA